MFALCLVDTYLYGIQPINPSLPDQTIIKIAIDNSADKTEKIINLFFCITESPIWEHIRSDSANHYRP